MSRVLKTSRRLLVKKKLAKRKNSNSSQNLKQRNNLYSKSYKVSLINLIGISFTY